MKKNIIILVSCVSLISLLSGCNKSESKEDLTLQENIQEENIQEENTQEDIQEEGTQEDDVQEEDTAPVEVIPPTITDDVPLIEINDYCKLIVHNIKNYHFEYIEDLFVNQMEIESWQEVLQNLGEFQNSIGVQTTMLMDFLYQDESEDEKSEDIDAYQVFVRESYLKDASEQELQIKIILTESLLISDLEIKIK